MKHLMSVFLSAALCGLAFGLKAAEANTSVSTVSSVPALASGPAVPAESARRIPEEPQWVTRFEWYAPNIVRVVKTPAGTLAAQSASLRAAGTAARSGTLTQYGTVAQSEAFQDEMNGWVVLRQPCVVSERDRQIRVELDGRGRVVFKTRNGKVLLREGEGSFTPIEDGPDRGSFVAAQAFLLDRDEPVYGVGLLQNGQMSQRGLHLLMMQSNTDDYAHFFQSIKGYGIFWNNCSPTRIDDDMDAEGLRLESQVAEKTDYYFIYGGDADGVIAGMRFLSGRVPMLPRWSYGFHQSRERYKSADEVLEVVDRYRRLGIPLDGIIQDWQYWGSNYTWNAMEFLAPEFNRAQQMIDRVHEMNARFEISIWAAFGQHTKPFAELAGKDLLYGFETWPQSALPQWPPRMDYPSGARVYVPYSAEACDIYWKYLNGLYRMGVDGWWMDSTDPDHHSFKEADLDEVKAGTSFRRVRNAFPLLTVGGVYNRQLAQDSADGKAGLRRPFILTRSYFAGQQRYGANTWTGDIRSSWDSFRRQVPMMINYSLTANPNCNTDIGGFYAGSYNRGYSSGNAPSNARYQELYTRWMQFGLFCPMMRSHGTEAPREIYLYGHPGEPVYEALVEAVKMRYRLLPYIYSTSWQVSRHDDSFVRGLMMDWSDDRAVWDCATEFMFGRSLLVAPVLKPLYTDERTDFWSGPVDWTQPKDYEVYLPKGSAWFDFFTGEKWEGGQTVTKSLTLADFPLFVPEGRMVPLAPDVQYTAACTGDSLLIRVFPGADAHFTLYEDEGDGFGYEEGLCSTIDFDYDESSGTLTIGRRAGRFEGMLLRRHFTVELVGGAASGASGSDSLAGAGLGGMRLGLVREVDYDGSRMKVKFDLKR